MLGVSPRSWEARQPADRAALMTVVPLSTAFVVREALLQAKGEPGLLTRRDTGLTLAFGLLHASASQRPAPGARHPDLFWTIERVQGLAR